jgi:hypothetical protein
MLASARRLVVLTAASAVLLCGLFAAPASAFRLPSPASPFPGNPADRLAALPADPEVYDRATGCSPRRRPGTEALVAWLQRNVRGAFWGSYRCERWGKGSASLHAENRAIDWHLDASVASDRAAARRLIHALLAPDRLGLPHALARRMGVDEIIWDCAYWGAGMVQFRTYSPCVDRATSTAPSPTATTSTSA